MGLGVSCFTGSGGFETVTGLTASTGFGLGCLTGSGGFETGSTGFETGFGLGCFTGSGGFETGSTGFETGFGLGCLTGSGGFETGSTGFETGFGLGCLTGSGGFETGSTGFETGFGLGCFTGSGGFETGSTGFGLGCLTGSGGFETGSTGFETGFVLGCLTGSGGFETGSAGFGVHCLTGCACFGLGGRATDEEGGAVGFATGVPGFNASYLAVTELTGGPGLGVVLATCGEGTDVDGDLPVWGGFMDSYFAVIEFTGGPGLGCFVGGGEDFPSPCEGFMASYLAVIELTGATEPGWGETLRTVAGALLVAVLLDDCTEAVLCLAMAGFPKLRLGSSGTIPSEFDTFGPGLGDLTGPIFFAVDAAELLIVFCDGFPYVVLGRGGAAPANAAVALLGSFDVWGLGGRLKVAGDLLLLLAEAFEAPYMVLGSGGAADEV